MAKQLQQCLFFMRQNRHCLVKLWKCQKAMSILPHEAKALLQLFCLHPIIFGWREISFSGALASWGKIKNHYFTWADQDWIGLMIFKNFADQDWIGFNFIRSGLDSDWKISQSAHLWFTLRLYVSRDVTVLSCVECVFLFALFLARLWPLPEQQLDDESESLLDESDDGSLGIRW